MKVLVLVLALLLVGCTTQYRYTAVPIGLIPLPIELPRVMAAELECLSDETYLRLVERDQLLRYENAQFRALLQPE
jgi:hypothetical protein